MRDTIKSHRQLKMRVAELREQREHHWKIVRERTGEIYDTVKNPAPIIKRALNDLASDKDVRTDLLKLALRYGSRFFSRKATEKARAYAEEKAGNARTAVVDWLLSRFKK